MDGQQKEHSDQNNETVVPDATSSSSINSHKLAQTLTPPTSSGATTAASPSTQRPASLNVSIRTTFLQPGSVLGGRYEIMRQLGEGDIGAVYRKRSRIGPCRGLQRVTVMDFGIAYSTE
jgi:hypothetical protein